MHDNGELRVTRRDNIIDSRTITLSVGPATSPTTFAVHEAILLSHSPFFRTALDKKWREGRSRMIELPYDDADVVAAYVDWLYFRKIASKPVSPPELPIDDGEYDFLARMYCFGEKIQADAFCDNVLDAMAAKTDDVATDGTRTFPSHSAIMALYNGTPVDSPARRFCVDMYAEFGAEKWVPKEAEFNHVEFLTDLARVLLERRQEGGLLHKQENWPRRRKWHKNGERVEFLQPASSRERMRIGAAE